MAKLALPGLFSSAVQRIKTQSVLAPLLALNVICGIMAIAVTLRVGETSLSWAIWSVFGISVLFTMVSYVVWSFGDPDRLQTEDYRLAQQHMTLIGDERNPNNAVLLDSKPVSNTAAIRLGRKE